MNYSPLLHESKNRKYGFERLTPGDQLRVPVDGDRERSLKRTTGALSHWARRRGSPYRYVTKRCHGHLLITCL